MNYWYSIFYAVTKRTRNRQQTKQTKNQLKLARKWFGSHKTILWPQKYVRLHLRRTPIMYYVGAHYVFFRKKIISKDTKAINYKMKKLNWFVHSSKRSSWDLQLSRICLKSTKRTSNMTKLKIHLLSVWKTRVEASKVITNSLKKLDFVTPIPFDTFPWNVLCNLPLIKLGNN